MSRATYYNLKKNTKKARDPRTVSGQNAAVTERLRLDQLRV